MIDFVINDKTVKPEKPLGVGDKVDIETSQDEKGLYIAINIRLLKAASRAPVEGAAGATAGTAKEEPEGNYRPTVMKPGPAKDGDDDAPPTLKHGRPAARKASGVVEDDGPQAAPAASTASAPVTSASSAEPRTAEPAAPPTPPTPSPSSDNRYELVAKARAASTNFLEGLPNFLCQQFTTRYVGEGHPIQWQAQDVVSAEVIYEGGKERYDKIAINGKAVKKNVEETGAWSTGEFGTVLDDLFSPATAAEFKLVGSRTVARQDTMLFNFTVDHPHSHWHVQVPGQSIFPAYKGSVWIAKESGRALRIEMQAVQIPKEFPEDTVEMAIDYDFVNFETLKFLLPVKAEILSCIRGSNECDRNVIEFRNYHKYTGESNITFK